MPTGTGQVPTYTPPNIGGGGPAQTIGPEYPERDREEWLQEQLNAGYTNTSIITLAEREGYAQQDIEWMVNIGMPKLLEQPIGQPTYTPPADVAPEPTTEPPAAIDVTPEDLLPERDVPLASAPYEIYDVYFNEKQRLEGQLAYNTQLGMTTTFSYEEALALGITTEGIDATWDVEFIPDVMQESGYDIRFVSPDGWSIGGTDVISPTGDRFTHLEMEQQYQDYLQYEDVSAQLTDIFGDELVKVGLSEHGGYLATFQPTVESVGKMLDPDSKFYAPERFMQALSEYATREQAEQLLRSMGVTDDQLEYLDFLMPGPLTDLYSAMANTVDEDYFADRPPEERAWKMYNQIRRKAAAQKRSIKYDLESWSDGDLRRLFGHFMADEQYFQDKGAEVKDVVNWLAPIRFGQRIDEIEGMEAIEGYPDAFMAPNGDIYESVDGRMLARWDVTIGDEGGYEGVIWVETSFMGIPLELPFKQTNPDDWSNAEKTAATFLATIGGLAFSGLGGIEQWLGKKGAGASYPLLPEWMETDIQNRFRMLHDLGEFQSSIGHLMEIPHAVMPITEGVDRMSWRNVNKLEFWATTGTQTITTVALLTPVFIGAWYAAAPLVGTLGLAQLGIGGSALGAVAEYIITATVAGLATRAMESSLEAGQAYDAAQIKGYDDTAADDIANTVFFNNMKFAGADAAEIASFFVPIGRGTTGSLLKRGLITTTRVGGKVVIAGLSEAGEEYYQYIVQANAFGEDINGWQIKENLSDAEVRQVVLIGMVSGIALGGIFDVAGSIRTRTRNNLSEADAAIYQEHYNSYIQEGMPASEADLLALDATVEESATAMETLKQATEYTKLEASQRAAQPRDADARAAWNDSIASRQAQVAPGITNTVVSEAEASGVPSGKKYQGPTGKLLAMVESWVPVRAETERLKSQELAKRARKIHQLMQHPEGRDTLVKSLHELHGELPKAQFRSPTVSLTPADIAALYDQIWTSDPQAFDRLNTAKALDTVVMEQSIPTRGEIEKLRKMFGPEIANELENLRPTSEKIWDATLEAWNFPKSVMAAWDASGALRQGGPLFIGQWGQTIPAIVPQAKAAWSEDYAVALDRQMRSDEWVEIRDAVGVYHGPLPAKGEKAPINTKEEAFLSSWAHIVPLVKRSERAFVTYLNKIRVDIFNYYASKWRDQDLQGHYARKFREKGMSHQEAEQAAEAKLWNDYKELARFINRATGRGGLWKLEKSAPLLNAVAFSARHQAGIVQTPLSLVSSSSQVRKIALKNLTAFVTGNLILLGVIEASGLGEVDKDPRSSDFLKIRVGDTRIDIWAGRAQYAIALAQFITGTWKWKSNSVQPHGRLSTVGRFLRGKASPSASLIIDILDGETFIGEDLTLKNTLIDRLTPLFVQDLMEVIEQEGLAGGLLALPGFLGTGITSYPDTLAVVTDELGTTITTDDGEERKYNTKDLYHDISQMTPGMSPDDVRSEKEYTDMVRSIVGTREVWNKVYGKDNMFADIKDEGDRSEARAEWLKQHPEENAMLALWGKAQPLTREAYNRMYELAKELGIAEDLLPEQVVPKEFSEAWFDMKDELAKEGVGENSAEIKIIKLDNPGFFEWGQEQFGWKPVTIPRRALEITVQWRAKDDEYDSIKHSDGSTQSRMRAKWLAQPANQEYARARRERQAWMEKPPCPEELIPDYINYYMLPSSKRHLYRRQHSEFNVWLIKEKGLQPLSSTSTTRRGSFSLSQFM